MPDPKIALGIGILVLLIGIFLFFPKGGLFGYWHRMRQMSSRVLMEDALKHIYKHESESHPATLQSVAGAIQVNVNQVAGIVHNMEDEGLVSARHGEVRLTMEGRRYALHIIRAHRLWERYLAEETGFEETEWHSRAEHLEHSITPIQLDELSTRLGNPTYDPHGDPIPTSKGEIKEHDGKPLTDIPLNVPANIVHLENEPQTIYAQLIAEGLYPSMEVRVLETSPQRIIFWGNGEEHRLAPIIAANVEVVPILNYLQPYPAESEYETLSVLCIGEKGKVIKILPRLRGVERRRFLDLGILPGTEISVEMVSPSGETTAYRIRDALIALHKEQAQAIQISRIEEVRK